MEKNVESRLDQVREQYERYKQRPFDINIARGIPAPEQLTLSEDLLKGLDLDSWESEDELDVRSYGGLLGIKEARRLFSELLGTTIEETIVGGNASLQLMYATLNHLMYTQENAWYKQGKVKFICPTPGYDRHWSMLDRLGIEMIPVNLTGTGPDMDEVEHLVQSDSAIKGIFCIPQYSNPTGEIYSEETVDKLAKMETAAEDFIIMWDNAYAVHHLTYEKTEVKNILAACKEAGYPNRPVMFVSTSKITLPGAGVAAIGASEERILQIAGELSKQIISFDKINQKRHVEFLKNKAGVEELMEKHAVILKPKFEWIQAIFEAYFSEERSKLVEWTDPKGGYFVHIKTKEECASEVVSKLKEIGITLTPANASYPHGKNPLDNSIRLAPSYARPDKLEVAVEALCVCIELVTLEKYGETILEGE